MSIFIPISFLVIGGLSLIGTGMALDQDRTAEQILYMILMSWCALLVGIYLLLHTRGNVEGDEQ